MNSRALAVASRCAPHTSLGTQDDAATMAAAEERHIGDLDDVKTSFALKLDSIRVHFECARRLRLCWVPL